MNHHTAALSFARIRHPFSVRNTNRVAPGPPDPPDAPINCLPDDILLTIFRLLIDDPERARHGGETRTSKSPQTRLNSAAGVRWNHVQGGNPLRHLFDVLRLTRDALGRWIFGRRPTRRRPRLLRARLLEHLMLDKSRALWSISWIKVTWVCRRWRSVALASAALWSAFVVGQNPVERLWVPAFLKRAAEAHLDISVDVDRLDHPTLKVLRPHSVSLRTLRLIYPFDRASTTIFETLLRSNAEHLETLVVIGNDETTEVSSKLHASAYTFPRLQSLTILAFPISISPIHCPSLRVLKNMTPLNGLDSTVLLNLLRQCPLIEELMVIVSDFTQAVPDKSPPVNLLNLRKLFLESCNRTVGLEQFYGRLCLRDECAIHLSHSITARELEVDRLSIIVSSLMALHRPLLSCRPSSFMLDLAGPSPLARFYDGRDAGWCVMISLQCGQSDTRPLYPSLSMLRLANLASSLQHLTSFTVLIPIPEPGFTPAVCAALLAAMPRLLTLDVVSQHPHPRIDSTHLWPFLHALQSLPDGADVAAARCPSLHTICLSRVTIDPEILHWLVYMLRVRAGFRRKIHSLAVTQACLAHGVDNVQLKSALKEHVDVLELDVKEKRTRHGAPQQRSQ
ncbi:hypothetical protein OH76DRAFT_136663 [Lentinus brumalis]|uniref:F-box domain-containing protein n=1 Tax=Lentinus brumalis TaxID=2498619 RepID=A0A371CPM6_9APHY|nr:hypothetical protein OH76DRAFT_136663 [Polyporus brumalis]